MQSTPYSIKPLLIASLLLFFTSCDNEALSVWNSEEPAPASAPVLNSVTPEGGYLAGVDAITITGSGFSNTAAENSVYFSNGEDNGVKGLVLSSTGTSLTVRPPQIVGDNIEIKATRSGAEKFSNSLTYKLSSPILNAYSAFNDKADSPLSIALDNNGDLFVALTSGGNAAGVIKAEISAEGTISTYVLPNNRFRFDTIEFTPDNRLYLCVGNRAVFSAAEGTKEAAHFIMPNPFNFLGLDMDDKGYMWLVGNNTHIVRHIPQETRVNVTNLNSLPDNTKVYPLVANLTGVFFYNNALLLVGSDDAGPKIWKAVLDTNSDITEVSVFSDLASAITIGSGDVFTDIVVAEDGMVYVSTNKKEGIFEISADGKTVKPLYEGVLYPSVNSLDWTDSEYLIAATTASNREGSKNSVIKINMQKKGAPDF